MNYSSLPYFIAVLALFSYASLPVVAKTIEGQIPPFIFMALVNACVGGISLILSYVRNEQIASGYIESSATKTILVFSVINVVAFWAFLYASSRLPIAQYQLFIILSPLVGGTLAYLFLGEPFRSQYFVSFVIVFFGLLVAIFPTRG